MYDNEDTVYTQELIAEIKNGKYKGETIALINQYSDSGAYDQPFHKGNDVFVAMDDKKENNELSGSITDPKRDHFIVIVGWVFLFTLLIIGKKSRDYMPQSVLL